MRSLRDDDGVVWEVWEVVPDQFGSEAVHPSYLPPELVNGWLAVRSSAGDHGRMIGYPPNWRTMPEHELLALCRTATTRSDRSDQGKR